MKRFAFLLIAIAAAALLLTPGVAFANFAIHGGYTQDTDACAGCHRAHTSVSSITWRDESNAPSDHSALLVSTAGKMYEFCYACHDNAAQGADTNVEGGQYKGNLYGTHNAPLNGGFFADTSVFGVGLTSKHVMETADWAAWGGAYVSGGSATVTNGTDPENGYGSLGAGNKIEMTCASCHDPHGSSNYRLLKDTVNSIYKVGGYNGDTPEPWVVSNEPGYPNGADGTALGWLKHQAGHDQIVAYTPNYTTPQYAKAPANDPAKGMSGWCAGCHNAYMETGTPHGADSQYDAMDGWGVKSRHRHPMNIALDGNGVLGQPSGYGANRTLTVALTPAADIPLPLAHNVGHGSAATTNTANDWIDCMTCHVAHGTGANMTGWANATLTDETGSGVLMPKPNQTATGGVDPTGDSALLRLDNRGVCEVCHNK